MLRFQGANDLDPHQIEGLADMFGLSVHEIAQDFDSFLGTPNTGQNLSVFATAEDLLQLPQQHACTPPHPNIDPGSSGFQILLNAASPSELPYLSNTFSDSAQRNETHINILGFGSDFEARDEFYALRDRGFSTQEVTTFTAHHNQQSFSAPTRLRNHHLPNHVERREGMDDRGVVDRAQDTMIGRSTTDHDEETLTQLLMTGPCSRDWAQQLKLLPLGPRRRPKKLEVHSSKTPHSKKVLKPIERRQMGSGTPTGGAGNVAHRVKSCIRCRLLKKRCIPNPAGLSHSCLTCLGSLSPMVPAHLPCLRYEIQGASLFRDQRRPWDGFGARYSSMEMRNITDWASRDDKFVVLTHGWGGVRYRLRLRRFMPKPGDILQKTWTHGSVKKYHDIPAYGIVDMQEMAAELVSYCNRVVLPAIEAFVQPLDKLFEKTYQHAKWWCKMAPSGTEKRLMANTLRIWTMARLTSNIEEICGGDVIGTVVDDQFSPYRNTVPVPPMACAQIEVASYSVLLHPLQRMVLKDLRTMLLTNPRGTWLTIYFTLFIILHSCSHVSRRDEEFGRDIGHTLRFTNAGSIADHHEGVLTLLIHFHYTCKTDLLSAMLDDSHELPAVSAIPHEFRRFIRWSGKVMKGNGPYIRAIRQDKNYGDDYYFVSQLFDENWTLTPIATPDEKISSRTEGP